LKNKDICSVHLLSSQAKLHIIFKASSGDMVQAALLGYKLASRGKVVQGGDGIIHEDVDSTVENYGKLAHDGMYETDQTILGLMIS
jgi:L-cysteine desulfidase